MVKITDKKLVIEIPHSAPEEFITDIRNAIITAVQNQNLDEFTLDDVKESNHVLMEILKHTFESR